MVRRARRVVDFLRKNSESKVLESGGGDEEIDSEGP